MSKLFLLISLMSFISIKAFSGFAENNEKFKCRDLNGGFNGDINSGYQKCLRSSGIIAVNRNINSNDPSPGDARLCFPGNPACASCIEKYGGGTPSQARTGVMNCVNANDQKVAQEKERQQRELERKRAEEARRAEAARRAEEAKKRTQASKQASPPPEANTDEIVVTAPRVCSKNSPAACKTVETCRANNGVWDDSEKFCSMANCPDGTTEYFEGEANNICTCNSDRNYSVERGSSQKCPSQCSAANNMEYSMIVRSCVCKSGYEDPTGTMASCVAKNSTPPTTNTVACLRELQEKVKNCSKTSSSAVDKCDGNKKSGNDSALDALQTLLVGGAQIMGASDNCAQTAVAGSTAYATLEQARNSCDNEINSCKSSCDEANAMLANKESIYQACRTNAWNDHACAAPGRTPYRSGQMPDDQPLFNTEYDSVNRGPFESQIQEMQVAVNQDNAKCDTGGTALVNREGLSTSMDRMNTAYKSASSCECQLSSGGSNCNNIVGPAECAANPTLAGCVKATINCLSATDNSPRCLCFKDPNSDGCKSIRTATGNGTVNGFAGGTPGAIGSANPAVAGSSPGGAASNSSISLGSLFSNSEIKPIASGTETSVGAGSSSPFGSATGSGGGGGFGGSGGSANANANANSAQGEDPERKGIKGFFEVAKGALGNLFKKGSSEKSSADYSQQFDANGNSINSKKWRPRGFGRGVAGANEEIGGKFEDIWKVMNKQYKVQDQKDNFIFGGEKN